jgi:uncharacterized protein with HEPN domain
MPDRDWKFRIADIIEAIKNVLDITREMNYELFQRDKKSLQAVLYNLVVIGEAARRLPEEVINKYPSIPWREMGDRRNIVIHEYFGVDNTILWETIKHELPPLVDNLKDIFSSG